MKRPYSTLWTGGNRRDTRYVCSTDVVPTPRRKTIVAALWQCCDTERARIGGEPPLYDGPFVVVGNDSEGDTSCQVMRITRFLEE